MQKKYCVPWNMTLIFSEEMEVTHYLPSVGQRHYTDSSLQKEFGNIADVVLVVAHKELVVDHLMIRTQYNEIRPGGGIRLN